MLSTTLVDDTRKFSQSYELCFNLFLQKTYPESYPDFRKKNLQVFVYTPTVYKRIKDRLKDKGVGELSSFELGGYFSPWHAVQMGRIQSASGNRTVTAWAERNLKTSFYLYTYASLLRLHGDADKLKELDSLLLNEAVLQLDLRTLTPIINDTQKRQWFEATLDNYLNLWEVNM